MTIFFASGLYRLLLYDELHVFTDGSFADGLEGETKRFVVYAAKRAAAYFCGDRFAFLFFGFGGYCLYQGLCDGRFVHQQILGNSLP
jgi:hypothetical protein